MKKMTISEFCENPSLVLNKVEMGENYTITNGTKDMVRITPSFPDTTQVSLSQIYDIFNEG